MGINRHVDRLSAALESASVAWPLVGFVFLYGVGAPLKHLMWLLGVLSLATLLRQPARWFQAPGMGYWLLLASCLFLPMLVSLFDAAQLDRGVSGVVRIGFYLLAGFWLLRWVPRPPQESRTLLALLAVLMLFVADGYFQLLTGTSVSGQTPLPIPEGYKITGSMGVDYGESLAILSPLLFEALRRHVMRLPLLWLCVPLLAGAVMISASRNSMVLLGLSSLCYLLIAAKALNVWQQLGLFLGGGLLLFSGVALPLLWLPHLAERLAALSELLHTDPATLSRALSWRPELWQAAWQTFLEHPLNGVGLRGSGEAMLPFLKQSPLFDTLPLQVDWYPHLMVLEVATDLGLAGLLGYGLFLWLVTRLLLRASGLARAFALMTLLAFFPLSASLSIFSYRISLLGWPALAFAVGLYAKSLMDADVLGNARRILIVRLSALGDVVFASSLISALRARYPEARISWLVEPGAAPLLRHNPELDEILIWDKATWREHWRQRRFFKLCAEVLHWRRLLKRRQFDVVFDVQGLFKSALLATLSGARHRVGFTGKENTAPLLTWPLSKRADTTFIGSEYRGFAKDVGLPTDDFRMSVALSDELKLLAQQEAEKGGYAVLVPFTTRPQKHWLDSHWFELAELIDRQYGLRVLMLGGPGDVEHADRLVENSVIENRAGAYSLDESAAVISRASLLVGVDTGLTHIGVAFGVPLVALFGSTRPYRKTGNENAMVIHHDLPCAPCRRHPTCGGRYECLTEITPPEVMSAITGLPGLN